MVAFGIQKRELKVFLERSLNSRERQILLSCYEMEGYTFSKIVKNISKFYSPSTIKLVLKRLKAFGIVDFGDSFNRGKPLVCTELGEILYEVLRGGENG